VEEGVVAAVPVPLPVELPVGLADPEGEALTVELNDTVPELLALAPTAKKALWLLLSEPLLLLLTELKALLALEALPLGAAEEELEAQGEELLTCTVGSPLLEREAALEREPRGELLK